MANGARWIARDNREWRHILGDNGARTHNRAFTDSDAGKDTAIETNPDVALDADGSGWNFG